MLLLYDGTPISLNVGNENHPSVGGGGKTNGYNSQKFINH